jgi:hypothetical protein
MVMVGEKPTGEGEETGEVVGTEEVGGGTEGLRPQLYMREAVYAC